MSDNENIETAWGHVEKLLNNLAKTLENLTTVQVRTLVTDLEFITETDDKNNVTVKGVQPKHDPNAAPQGFVTTINMVGSDIDFDRSPNLPKSIDADKLEALHTKHVEMARKIFQDNVDFVVKTVHRFTSSGSQE